MTEENPHVNWWERARWKVRSGESLIKQLSDELKIVFANQGLGEITVYDVFLGYNQDEQGRIVLAVTATAAGCEDDQQVAPPQSNLVKIGRKSEVNKDYDGWSKTLAKKGLVSRLLSPVRSVELPDPDRSAVVYHDAYRLYGAGRLDDAARPLEEAVNHALLFNAPDCKSLERMFVELYSDLFRCCYRSASDQHPQRVFDFYKGELTKEFKRNTGTSAWRRWNDDPELQLLRRDALWLTTALRRPNSTQMPLYLDPVDYFRAVLIDTDTPQVPPTLVGPGHGDLHGRNVVVGVLRNEVFQPSVFDYGDMSLKNLPAWDFVKLEMELKCRLLPDLVDSPEARSALRHYLSQHINDMPDVLRRFQIIEELSPAEVDETSTTLDEYGGDEVEEDTQAVTADQADAAKHVKQLEMAVLFEHALAHLTLNLNSKAQAEKSLADENRSPTRHPKVDRALCLFYSLRKEAACWLGYELDRHHLWRDEYYFALAAYGLLTAKWRLDDPHQAWALMTAGVAVTQLSAVTNRQTGLVARLKAAMQQTDPVTSISEYTHLIPLAHGTRLSEADPPQHEASAAILKQALQQFPNAMSLRTELALALANSNQLEAARAVIQDIRTLCITFRDHELLSRLGRVYKEIGDALWAADNPRLSLADFIKTKHAGYQRYGQALECYRCAFRFSGHYYPAINAATMALLHGQPELAKQYARAARKICGPLRPDEDEQLWVFATEGEACLILGEYEQAQRFYESAFKLPQSRVRKMINSIAKQLHRLNWAIEHKSWEFHKINQHLSR